MSKNRVGRVVPEHPFILMGRVYRHILPGVKEQLSHWRRWADTIPDPELRTQAIASMTSKRFHCEGGAIYAAANLAQKDILIPLIVALQTISDYLDNLCDRSTSLDAADFRCLHQSMLDAINPKGDLHDYYAYHAEKEDGGYLLGLVLQCRACIERLPSYSLVHADVLEFVTFYADLQVHKHIAHELREEALHRWWTSHQADYPEISWNEFAAATGSTLGMFMLFLAAAEPELTIERVRDIRQAYFPYVCSLHILLDYFIDEEEDRIGGDLNFCSYYKDKSFTVKRIVHIVERAKEKVAILEVPAFHRMVIEGLLALYLSDPKVSKQREVKQASRVLMKDSPWMRLFFWVNSMWIRRSSG